MPRFLSRAGTHIDDLERQLARVGSTENDASADESANDSKPADQIDETAALLRHGTGKAEDLHDATAAPSSRYAATEDFGSSVHRQQHHSRISPDHTGRGEDGAACPGSRRRRRSIGDIQANAPHKLGTWDGVFLPVMLSIWGILVFVRMGYFLSQVGIMGTIGSFVGGYLITTMTTLSISAISTNGTVKGGGPYYMLSRSLGPEFGGSIGLMFYAGTLLAGVLNDVAFVEPLLNNFGSTIGDITHTFPEGKWWCVLYNSILLIFCTVVCLTGAQVFAKASTVLSTPIIAATAMILASFAFRAPFVNEEKAIHYTGWSMDTFKENLWPDLSPISEGRPSETLGTVLGVLFPACVGIMAGASMSSALRKPSKSIPKGTLWAVLITFILYLTIAISLGSTTRRSTLRDDFNILQEINLVPLIVPIGAITTSVTSTLSGVLSSASILQAIAKDDLFAFLKPLKKTDRNDNPVRSIVITYAISQLALFAGDINAVAPYTTMFNLIMFGFVNLACLVLKLAASVNFRPTFHYFKAWTAFLGAAGCFGVMIFVDPISALISTAVVVVLFLYVHYTCPPKAWGDVTQSLIYHQCRKYMLRLDLRKDHVKFWRPQILLLVHNPRSSFHLIRFCNALKKGGLYVIGHVIKGSFYELLPELKQQEAAWMRLIDVARVKAFLNLAIDKSEDAGARSIVFGAGLGGMRPNIVVMGFLKLDQRRESDPERTFDGSLEDHGDSIDDVLLPTDNIQLNTPISPVAYLRIIEDVLLMGKAVGIAYGFSKLGLTMPALHDPTPPHPHSSLAWPLPKTDMMDCSGQQQKKYIDLWPIQIGTATTTSDSGQRAYLTNFDSYVMVLQLGTVLHLVPYWSHRYKLRVMCFVEDQSDVEEETRRVAKLLRDLRVMAELHVHYLRGAGISAYDEAVVSGTSTSTSTTYQSNAVADHGDQRTPGPSAAPNATAKPESSQGVSFARPSAVAPTEASPQLGFSMKVNLPMPLRYESTRLDQGSSDSDTESESDFLSDIAGGTGIDSHSSGRGANANTASLGRYATISEGNPGSRRKSLLPRGLWGRRTSVDIEPGEHSRVRIRNIPLGNTDHDISLVPRRSSDGSMALSNFYSRALAAATSQTSEQAVEQGAGGILVCSSPLESGNPRVSPPPPELSSSGQQEQQEQEQQPLTEFNDMPISTQNRILNEMIRRESQASTALIFTTLQAPELGTSESEQKTMEYLEGIDALARGLPPVFLVHATSLTVTTSL